MRIPLATYAPSGMQLGLKVLGGFAATFTVESFMKMGSCVGSNFWSGAALRVCVAVLLIVSLALPALGMKHPTPLRAQREQHVVATHATKRATGSRAASRVELARKPAPKVASRQGKHVVIAAKPSARTVKAVSRPVKPAAKPPAPAPVEARSARPRPEADAADDEPETLPNIRHDRKSLRKLHPAQAAPVASSGKRVLTSADFLRAAGKEPQEVEARPQAQPLRSQQAQSQQPQAETFERGESHPDESEPVLVTAADGADAAFRTALPMASAAPSPITPAGKPNLPEKLQTLALKAGRTVKADAAAAKNVLAKTDTQKPPSLPVTKAERDAVIEQAMTPMVLPLMYKRNGHLIVPPPMKGTHDILVHQNLMADSAGLERIQDDEDLERMRSQHLLVALADSRSLEVNSSLPLNRRYARPWTARFAADTASQFYARFHQPLRLNSAVRTVAYQLRLQRVNGNAAGIDGENASPHLTGQAIDLGKRGMSMAQIAWMRAYLAPLMQSGKIDVEEEFQQACFHISVYRAYLPALRNAKALPKLEVAQMRQPAVGDDLK